MNAEILTLGNELLYGQTIDTNASWIARRLADATTHVITRHRELRRAEDRTRTGDTQPISKAH